MESTWYLCRLFCQRHQADLLQNCFTVDIELIVFVAVLFCFKASHSSFVIVIVVIFEAPVETHDCMLENDLFERSALNDAPCYLVQSRHKREHLVKRGTSENSQTDRWTDFCFSCGFHWRCDVHSLSSVCVVFFFACVRVFVRACPATYGSGRGLLWLGSAWPAFIFSLWKNISRSQPWSQAVRSSQYPTRPVQELPTAVCVWVGVCVMRKEAMTFWGEMAAY